MEYPVHIIQTRDTFASCPYFSIDNFQWTCIQKPMSRGQLAYIPKEGYYLRMECFESNPLRNCTAPQSQVCCDSALEAFFTFDPHCCDDSGYPSNDCLYLNFEMNANGAMHAKYGKGRKGRREISAEDYKACNCHAWIYEKSWEIQLLIPSALIKKLYGIGQWKAGDDFFCNFYKISETSEIEHYASFNKVLSETPNFHLPEFFAHAVLKDK